MKVLSGTWGGTLNWDFYINEQVPNKEYVTSVGAFPFFNNGVLITKNARGWELPVGHIEIGESFEETITREIMEETGGIVSQLDYVGYFHLITDKPIEKNDEVTIHFLIHILFFLSVYVVMFDSLRELRF